MDVTVLVENKVDSELVYSFMQVQASQGVFRPADDEGCETAVRYISFPKTNCVLCVNERQNVVVDAMGLYRKYVRCPGERVTLTFTEDRGSE